MTICMLCTVLPYYGNPYFEITVVLLVGWLLVLGHSQCVFAFAYKVLLQFKKQGVAPTSTRAARCGCMHILPIYCTITSSVTYYINFDIVNDK